jgi:predicted amidohydrolase
MEAAWADLVRYLRASPSDVVVLPEMPFCEWEMFRHRSVDLAAWRAALSAHDAMMPRLAELETRLVLSSRPVEVQGKRLDQAFSWTRTGGYRGARAKYYLPDEPDGWEASWFERGDREFSPQAAGPVKVGFQLCTELLFSHAAWEIGHGGGQLTPDKDLDLRVSAARSLDAPPASLSDPAELLEDLLAVRHAAGDLLERLCREQERRLRHELRWLAARVVHALDEPMVDGARRRHDLRG